MFYLGRLDGQPLGTVTVAGIIGSLVGVNGQPNVIAGRATALPVQSPLDYNAADLRLENGSHLSSSLKFLREVKLNAKQKSSKAAKKITK